MSTPSLLIVTLLAISFLIVVMTSGNRNNFRIPGTTELIARAAQARKERERLTEIQHFENRSDPMFQNLVRIELGYLEKIRDNCPVMDDPRGWQFRNKCLERIEELNELLTTENV